MSGAMTSREQDKGRPPPRMSSKEAMPDEVRMVEGENGEGRVPARWSTDLELDFLLKVDMIRASGWGTALIIEINRGTGGGGRNFHLNLILTMTRPNVIRRLRPPILGALYVRFPPFLCPLQTF